MPDRNPLRGIDWENIDGVAREAGQQVHEFITQLRDGVIEWIKSTTGIDLSGIAEFSDSIFEALASSLNLSEGGAGVLKLLEGLVTLDPRGFLDQLAGLFGGGAGLELPAIFTGLGEMLGGLTPAGQFDASKLVGELPQEMVATLRAVLKALFGNVELGQLWRPPAGQEKNWLEPFDTAASIKTDVDPAWSWDASVGRTAPGSAKCTLDGTEHVQTSEAIDAAPGQPLDVGGKLRWTNFTGTGGPAFVLRTLAYSVGDQLLGSQQIGAVTPPSADAPDFEAGMAGSWAPPAGTAYVRVRMECTAAATGGAVNWDDLWLRKPAVSMPQDWITGLVPGLADLSAGVLGAWDQAQQTIDRFMNGRGLVGSGFSLSHFETEVAKVFGPGSSIPKDLVAGLDDALGVLLPKADWTKFLSGFTAAGNNGTAPSTGIPALDGLINAFLGVRSTATGAQESVSAVASSALTTVVVNPDETITRTVYTPGSYTWNRPAPSSGKKITKFGIHVIGAGQGGGKAAKGNGQGAADGIDGGAFYIEVLPADMPASLSVVVANGGAGATSTGPGAMPSATRVMNGAIVFAEATMGAAFAKLVGAIPVRLETKPGRGGRGGDALLKDITTDSNGAVTGKSYSRGDGEGGESCAGGVGGAGGRSSGGWLGGSTTNAAAGPAARTDPVYRFGAPGGGGGYAGPNSTTLSGDGAPGGNPGGGGGGGGGSPYTGLGGGTGNGAAGGPGEITFYVFEEPV
ncbi:hypothetical protein [Tsukamurella serpentis]